MPTDTLTIFPAGTTVNIPAYWGGNKVAPEPILTHQVNGNFQKCEFIIDVDRISGWGYPGYLNAKLQIQVNDNGVIRWITLFDQRLEPTDDRDNINPIRVETNLLPWGIVLLEFNKNNMGDFYSYDVILAECQAIYTYGSFDRTIFVFSTNIQKAEIQVTVGSTSDVVTATEPGVYISIDPPAQMSFEVVNPSGFLYWLIDGVQQTGTKIGPMDFIQYTSHSIRAVYQSDGNGSNLLLLAIPFILIGGIVIFTMRGKQR